MESQLTIFYNYYNQVDMLKKQVNLWKSYSNTVLNQIKILLIDDCSKVHATDILKELEVSSLPISVYRVNEDKYCNVGGTRNLACKVAETEWVLITDMDIILIQETLQQILNLQKNKNKVYKFNRIRPDKTLKFHPGVCLISKNTYWHIGGCDEDFVGNYGQTDVHFFYRANEKKIQTIFYEDIYLIEDNDGITKEIDRSKEMLQPNIELLKNKKLNNQWSSDYIRFSWNKEL